MSRPIVALALALAVAGPQVASAAFLADNGMRVEAVGPATFDVAYQGRSGAISFWCAAGDYARRELGLRSDRRIYRVSVPPRRSGEGIRFTTRAAASGGSTGLLRIGGGDAVSVGHARALCEIERRRYPGR